MKVCCLRLLLLDRYRRGINAAEAYRDVTEFWGEDIVTESTVQLWFSTFRKGDTGVEAECRVCQELSLSNGASKNSIEAYHEAIQEYLAEESGVSLEIASKQPAQKENKLRTA
ncbi:hypothetical protein M514_05689, partial [Trichuris suis]